MNKEIETAQSISLIDLVIVVLARWKLMVLGPAAIATVVYGLSHLMAPIYTGRTLLMLPTQQSGAAGAALQSLGALANIAGVGTTRNAGDQYVSLVQSTTIANRVIKKFDLTNVYEEPSLEKTRAILAARSRFSLGKKDGLMSLEVDDTDPLRAANMTNQYSTELQNLLNELAISEAKQRRLFFEKELDRGRKDLAKAQTALEGSTINDATLMAEPRNAAGEYAELRAKITSTEIEIASLGNRVTEMSPEIKTLRNRLSALRSQLAKKEAGAGSRRTDEYISKYRDYKYREALLEILLKQYEIARLDEAKESTAIQVVDPATPPERKTKPERLKMAVYAWLASLLLAFLHVITSHLWRESQKGESGRRKAEQLKAALKF